MRLVFCPLSRPEFPPALSCALPVSTLLVLISSSLLPVSSLLFSVREALFVPYTTSCLELILFSVTWSPYYDFFPESFIMSSLSDVDCFNSFILSLERERQRKTEVCMCVRDRAFEITFSDSVKCIL